MQEAQALVRQEQAIAQPISYSREQLDLIKSTYAKGTTDAEFQLFVQTAQYRRLDILKRQICLIGFWDKDAQRNVFQPAVTIEGQRSKAEDTGLYRGQTKAEWCGPDAKWVDVWLSAEPPAAARVGVYREGFAEPVYGVARFDSYAARDKEGRLKAMWAKMPDHMIAKVAEALAFRKAFPDDLGGLYTQEEMEQTGNEPTQTLKGSASNGSQKPQSQATKSISTEEAKLNQILLNHSIALKGNQKAGEAYFKGFFYKKSFAEKQEAVLDLGLLKVEETAVVDAEIIEERETAEI